MFALVHQMRARIVTSPSFNGDRILAAILFEGTMDRQVGGQLTADYLWNAKRIVPFLKVDKGLADEKDGVQIMKPILGLSALLDKAKTKRIFGTKMRSIIKKANASGIHAVVDQQFEVAAQILVSWPCADRRTGSRYSLSGQTPGRGLAQSGPPRKSQQPASRSTGDAQDYAAGAR